MNVRFGYLMGMARRDMRVQLGDEPIADPDRIAAAGHTNRSEPLRRGATAMMEAEEEDAELLAASRGQSPYPVLPQPKAGW